MGKLSKAKVGDLHPLIVEKISLFVDRVTDLIKEHKPIDVFTGWRCMTLDIVSEFAFGQCLDSLHCPDFKHSMIDTMTQVGDFFYIVGCLQSLAITAYLCGLTVSSHAYISLQAPCDSDSAKDDPRRC